MSKGSAIESLTKCRRRKNQAGIISAAVMVLAAIAISASGYMAYETKKDNKQADKVIEDSIKTNDKITKKNNAVIELQKLSAEANAVIAKHPGILELNILQKASINEAQTLAQELKIQTTPLTPWQKQRKEYLIISLRTGLNSVRSAIEVSEMVGLEINGKTFMAVVAKDQDIGKTVPFLKEAKVDDILVVFQDKEIAVVYRPSTKTIINKGPFLQNQ